MASLVWAAALLAVVLAADLALAAEAGVPALPGIEGLPSVQDLPDLLVMMDGSRVTTREAWETRRKPELKALFQHYMYGFFPPAAKVRATVAAADVKALGGAATMKRVALGFEPPGCPAIDLLVVVPNRREGPAPVFLGLNFTGNHTVLADPSIPLAKGWMRDGPGVVGNRATEAGRGTAAEKWAVEHVVGRGYAVATFYYGDMVPDKPEMDGGVYPHVRPAGAAAPSPTDWGAIAAWAWGLQRAVDYLVTDKDVDPRRIVLFGHSRNGKAALLAAAFDERVAAVIPHQAGCGGTAPSRRKNPKGESVTAINTRFPHWFNDIFPQFNDREDRLPFDQHGLAALCAPRPVLFPNGTKDQWADPPGQFDVLRAATPVYRLLGAVGMPDNVTGPELDKRVGEELAFYLREAPHTVDRAYWDVFVDFAEARVPPKK